MDKERIIKYGSHVLVGAAAVWFTKQLGLKQGTIPAVLLAVAMHAYFDAPLATSIREIS